HTYRNNEESSQIPIKVPPMILSQNTSGQYSLGFQSKCFRLQNL
ncbi:uncharacterized protein METZ01_LOCUS137130, partial [marine metagenome]